MAKKLDYIIVIDLEATCWGGDPPPGEQSEIIEIGLCILDTKSGERIKRDSILVRPERSKVSPFCTKLTTLTQAQVDQGSSFSDAIQYLSKTYRPHDYTWASYGDYDRVKLESQCREWGISYPFGRTHINVKNMLALSLNLPAEIGLDRALDQLGLPMEGTHHRGDADAWNIGAILGLLLTRVRNQP